MRRRSFGSAFGMPINRPAPSLNPNSRLPLRDKNAIASSGTCHAHAATLMTRMRCLLGNFSLHSAFAFRVGAVRVCSHLNLRSSCGVPLPSWWRRVGLSGQAHPRRMMRSAACRWGLTSSLPSTGNKVFDIRSLYSDTFQSFEGSCRRAAAAHIRRTPHCVKGYRLWAIRLN